MAIARLSRKTSGHITNEATKNSLTGTTTHSQVPVLSSPRKGVKHQLGLLQLTLTGKQFRAKMSSSLASLLLFMILSLQLQSTQAATQAERHAMHSPQQGVSNAAPKITKPSFLKNNWGPIMGMIAMVFLLGLFIWIASDFSAMMGKLEGDNGPELARLAGLSSAFYFMATMAGTGLLMGVGYMYLRHKYINKHPDRFQNADCTFSQCGTDWKRSMTVWISVYFFIFATISWIFVSYKTPVFGADHPILQKGMMMIAIACSTCVVLSLACGIAQLTKVGVNDEVKRWILPSYGNQGKAGLRWGSVLMFLISVICFAFASYISDSSATMSFAVLMTGIITMTMFSCAFVPWVYHRIALPDKQICHKCLGKGYIEKGEDGKQAGDNGQTLCPQCNGNGKEGRLNYFNMRIWWSGLCILIIGICFWTVIPNPNNLDFIFGKHAMGPGLVIIGGLMTLFSGCKGIHRFFKPLKFERYDEAKVQELKKEMLAKQELDAAFAHPAVTPRRLLPLERIIEAINEQHNELKH